MQNQPLTQSLALVAIGLCAACGSDASSASHDRYTAVYPTDDYGQGIAAAVEGGSAAQAGRGAQLSSAAPTESVELTAGAGSASHLVDSAGRALYLFANDIPATNTSACVGECLDKWPVFDAKELSVGAGLLADDFDRFKRADGLWQTTFKDRPLYRFAADAADSVQGDGAAGRWYVARDYAVFMAAKTDVTPEGATMPAPFMTNRAGRTVYVSMNDTAGTAGSAPASACAQQCLDAWPVWSAPAMLDSMVLPSSMRASDFGELERGADGAIVKQLTYRGYPLYFHAPDVAPGQTSGHLTAAWRTIDPSGFGAATR